jgi:hypothetical protein
MKDLRPGVDNCRRQLYKGGQFSLGEWLFNLTERIVIIGPCLLVIFCSEFRGSEWV